MDLPCLALQKHMGEMWVEVVGGILKQNKKTKPFVVYIIDESTIACRLYFLSLCSLSPNHLSILAIISDFYEHNSHIFKKGAFLQ